MSEDVRSHWELPEIIAWVFTREEMSVAEARAAFDENKAKGDREVSLGMLKHQLIEWNSRMDIVDVDGNTLERALPPINWESLYSKIFNAHGVGAITLMWSEGRGFPDHEIQRSALT